MEHLKCFLRDSEVEENNTKSLNVETVSVSRSSQDFGVLSCDLEKPARVLEELRGDPQAEWFFSKTCLVPRNFHANLSPNLIQLISVNVGFYPIIFCPTLNLGINQVD